MANIYDIIEENREAIRERAVELYRNVLECNGRINYGLYIWSDGELEALERVDHNSWLQAPDHSDRKLYNILTVEEPFFNPADCFESKPESDEQAEEWAKMIIDEMVTEYSDNFDNTLDEAIAEMKEAEKLW